MGIVTADVSVSLDGYIAGPNDGRENGLGDGGERLHEWMFDNGEKDGETGRDDEIVAEYFANVGAYVMGRRMFDNGEGPWGDDAFEGHWGDEPPFRAPVFVLTHHPREPLEMKGGTTFTFVTDGIESAFEQAKVAAGDKDVSVAGGANIIQQFVASGLLDEIEIHLVPVLLGGGIRLFERLDAGPTELERTRVVESPRVTHLGYRVVTEGEVE